MLHAQPEFFHQARGAAATTNQLQTRLLPLGFRRALGRHDAIVFTVSLEQHGQRPQVMRKPSQNLVLLQLVADRHLNRPIERQLLVVDALERPHDRTHDESDLQQFATKTPPRQFDFPSQRHFFFVRQQRDLADLIQIQAQRIIGPSDVVRRHLGAVFVPGGRIASAGAVRQIIGVGLRDPGRHPDRRRKSASRSTSSSESRSEL